jgi:hypothetical protein
VDVKVAVSPCSPCPQYQVSKCGGSCAICGKPESDTSRKLRATDASGLVYASVRAAAEIFREGQCALRLWKGIKTPFEQHIS